MTCMHDRDTQCFSDCPNCVRREVPECCNCGTTRKLVSYEDEKYCPECLAERLLAETDEKIASFVDNYYNDFVNYLASVC